ncbi:MAG TPA: dihydrofolate reductase, partial [Candidatus Saccharimonadales bacterium]|nr:dihydrofolate reductase [Candidatus Saccharimonadales bacterium]
MGVSLIVAVSDNDVIGRKGVVPWFVRGDQAIFKRITFGKPVIMGRVTYEAPKTYKAKPRLLPGRLNVIVSRNPSYQVPEGGVVASSLKDALDLPAVKESPEVFVIGGEQLLNEALPLAGKVYLTRVHTVVADGDKFFKFDPGGWKLVHSEFYKKDEVPDRPFDFE